MNYTDEIIEKLRLFGQLNYTPEKIASIMRTTLNKEDLQQLTDDLRTPGSTAFTEFMTGMDTADLNRDVALLSHSCSNNPKGREVYDEVVKTKQLDEIINNKFGV